MAMLTYRYEIMTDACAAHVFLTYRGAARVLCYSAEPPGSLGISRAQAIDYVRRELADNDLEPAVELTIVSRSPLTEISPWIEKNTTTAHARYVELSVTCDHTYDTRDDVTATCQHCGDARACWRDWEGNLRIAGARV